MKKTLKFIAVFLASTAVTFGIIRQGGNPFGHHIKFVFNFFWGFALVVLSLKFRDKKTYWRTALIPPIVFTIITLYFTRFQFYQLATPSTWSIVAGGLLGWLYLKNRQRAYYFLGLAVILNVYVWSSGYDTWLHKLNHGTYFGGQDVAVKEVFFENENETLTYFDNADTYYLLDFWNTSCGICIKEFPKVQSFFEEQINNFQLNISLIDTPHIRVNEKELARQIVVERGITIPLLYHPADNESLRQKYMVSAVPTVLIIKNGKIIHKGSFKTAKRRLKKLKVI